jgi:hypothetical protein
LLRSVYPTSTGTLVSGARSLITDQESPLADRWGGWYVTGQLAQMHNLITLTNYKARMALYSHSQATSDTPLPDNLRQQFERPSEQVVRYLEDSFK